MTLQLSIRRTLVYLALILGTLFAFNAQQRVLAQSDEVLEVKPAILDVGILPGQTIVRQIAITNLKDQALAIEAKSTPLLPFDDVLSNYDRTKFDASSWLRFSGEIFLLEPFETRIVEISITAPGNAAPGGHYVAPSFKVIDSSPAKDDIAVISPTVSVVTLLSVPGKIVEDLELTHIKFNKFSMGGDPSVSFKLVNKGNLHLLPRAQVIYRDSQGEVIYIDEPAVRVILPETERVVTSTLATNAFYKRFSTEVVINYGSPSQTLIDTSSMLFILPEPIWLLVLASALLYLYKKQKRKPNSKTKK